MNLVLGVISLVFCTGFGYLLSRKYSSRREFYSDFFNFNKNLKTEINFLQNSLIAFIERFSDKKTIFYVNLVESLRNNTETSLDKNYFSEEEIAFFNNYLDNLGASDKQTQILFLESADAYLINLTKSSEEEERKYKTLYIKMGFLIGLIAFIILL